MSRWAKPPSSPGRVTDRLRMLALACALLLLGAVEVVTGASAQGAATNAAAIGSWSTPFDIGVKGIHTSLLPNGKVLFFSYPVTAVGSDAFVWDPATGTETNVSLNWPRDIFCAGHAFLPDGRLLITGGHVHAASFGLGVANTDIFDPATNTFTSGPMLSQARWYPTSIETGSGDVLTFGGQVQKGTYATSVDDYNPTTNTMTTLPSTATKQVQNYPRLHLLPNGKISYTNGARALLFDPAGATWSNSAVSPNPGRGESDSSILLPGLWKVLEFGGNNGSGGASATAQIIDFSSAVPAWRSVASMTYPRVWSNGVLLPGGNVLAVGGGTGGTYTNPVEAAELFNTTTETWSVMASQVAPRVYHSTAILLPDGRVLSAGDDNGTMQTTAEIYSPPYLFQGARPQITGAPSRVGYGQTFSVSVDNASAITHLELIRPATVTHAINTDQRLVDLTFTPTSATTLSVTAPPDGNHAPPGPYMLFAVNSSGVPSVAAWVSVNPVVQTPTISGFSPTSGPPGTTVAISGSNLSGATRVTFGGVSATTFSVVSASEVDATVPSGAATGSISITTPSGTATSSGAFTVTALPSYHAAVIQDGAVGYWRLSDTTSTALDSSGKSTNGVYTGGVTHAVPGALATDADTAASFDGSTGYVAVPDAPALHLGDTFTYELWVKRGATIGVTQRLLHKGAGAASLGFGSNNKLVLLPGGSGAALTATTTVGITDQSWHYVVATKSGTSVHIYVDGVDRTAAGTNTTMTSNTTSLDIARATAANAYFSGALDEVAVYPVALTPAQVQLHYQAATG